jgi:3-phosphoglycerate kinase
VRETSALGKRTVDDLELENGERVLERVDFNVPLDDDGKITDDSRIRASLPTIELLLEKGARLILVSHLGRPKGSRDPKTSMKPASERLAELIDAPVEQADDVVGDDAKAKAEALEPGSVLVLENSRWEEGEEENDPELSKALASLADVYVNDAFGAAHRAHATTAGVAEHLPAVAGKLLELEVTTLRRIVEEPERPFVVVLGGLKVSGKIGLINRFLEVADSILLGGAMSYQFFRAMGRETGNSYVDEEGVELAKDVLEKSEGDARATLVFPVDLVAGDEFDENANVQELEGTDVPEGWEALDIGKRTREIYSDHIREAGTVFWNGPMGAFEMEPFSNGTRAIAETVAAAPGTTVAGGGDSVSALAEFGLAERVDHLSTGGGASLELLEGKELPGVEVLDDA